MSRIGKIIITALFACVVSHGNAQFCGTKFRGDVKQLRAEAAKMQHSRKSMKSSDIQYVALTVFNVESLGANLPLEVDKLYEGLDFANRYYAPAGIQFFICGSPRSLLGNTSYTYSESRRLLTPNNVSNTINIYYVDEVFAADLVIGGFSSFPWEQEQLIVIDKGFISNSLSSGGILAHELGHHLGLFHTHETFMGVELVNGSNCESAGDLICDTNADFNLSTGGLEGCNYVGNFVDVNGDLYNPDPRNIMSYAPSECLSRISELQAERINFYYNQEFSGYLQDCDFYPDLSVDSDIADLTIFSGQPIELELNLGNQNSNNESVRAEILFSITNEDQVSNFLIHS